MDEVFSNMADQENPKLPQLSRSKNGFSRADVVDAFVSAFQMIGGVPRLAMWANANPDKFFPLYAKLLPATTQVIGDMGELVIVHRIAPTMLDQHGDQQTIEMEQPECLPSSSGTNQEATSPHFTLATRDGVSLLPTDEPGKQSPP